MAAALTPLGRPGDVADVVAFLAGPDARSITGQKIDAGGGLAQNPSPVRAPRTNRANSGPRRSARPHAASGPDDTPAG